MKMWGEERLRRIVQPRDSSFLVKFLIFLDKVCYLRNMRKQNFEFAKQSGDDLREDERGVLIVRKFEVKCLLSNLN